MRVVPGFTRVAVRSGATLAITALFGGLILAVMPGVGVSPAHARSVPAALSQSAVGAESTLTGHYRVTSGKICHAGTTYKLAQDKSALLITDGFDGGQMCNLDAIAEHKGVTVPLAIGSHEDFRAVGVGTIHLTKSGTHLSYRATVPVGDGTFVTATVAAVAT